MFRSDRRDAKAISNVLWELHYTDDQLDRLDKAMTRMSDRSWTALRIFCAALAICIMFVGLGILFWNPVPVYIGVAVIPIPLMVLIHYESRYGVVRSIHSGVMIDIVVNGLEGVYGKTKKEGNDRIDDGQQ